MSYPGNSSLAEEIQQKILSTFEQTLELAEQGRREEALLGCDFVRRLDPQFAPAEDLLARLEGQDGAVPVDDLRAALVTGPVPIESDPIEPDPGSAPPPSADAQVDELFAALDRAESTEEEGEATTFELSEEDVALGTDAYLLSDISNDLAEDGDDSVPEPRPATPQEAPTPAPPEATAPPEKPEPPAPEESPADFEPPIPETATATPEPAAALDRESEERVEQLLEEGQAAFENTEYQSAIDAWSRIFLIDIDHPEANRRIELARKLKAEVERKVEELFHDAVAAMESGEMEVAAEGFNKVLVLQPSHLAAQEHLDRLSAGEVAPDSDSLPSDDPGALPDIDTSGFDEDESLEGEPDFEPLAPPPPGQEPAPSPPVDAQPTKPAPKQSRKTAIVIAGLVLVIAVAAAWFLRSNWTRFFPNAGEEATTAPGRPKIDPIVRAQSLHVDGNTAMAISQLRRLPPAHPQYAQAQALIAQWETVLEEDLQQAGPTAEEAAERDELVAKAREAFANREFLKAEEFFALAAQAAPLDEGAAALEAETADRLEPLRTEIDIFRQGEWGFALRTLWLKYEADPGNPDIRRLMTDGYYNLGIRELQRGDPISALENLSEASSLASDDAEIKRLLDFATLYTQRSPDLQYRIFVKYLPFR